MVVNDAATVPASIHGETVAGHPVELRLAAQLTSTNFQAIALGAGDWRTPTEHRPQVQLERGDRIRFDEELSARVLAVHDGLLEIAFDSAPETFWPLLYRHAKPVQYSYLWRDLGLDEVQVPFAGRPWSFEMPSAGRPLSWSLILALKRRGVGIHSLTHAAGLSSSGRDALDQRLPLPERYRVPTATQLAIARAQERGTRVIAVGTTVVRALEDSALGSPRPEEAVATLKISGAFRPQVVTGVLSGTHEAGSSHFALLEAFAPRPLLEAAHRLAAERGHLGHEFGDSVLVLPGALGGT